MRVTADTRPASYVQTPPHRGLALAVMAAGMFLVLLDVTVVNVALPGIGAELHTGHSDLQWVVDGYTVPFAALLLGCGALGDAYGHRRMVLAGLVLFGAASVGCGAAMSPGLLVGARAVQGMGAALLLPGTLAMVTRLFPERREQARAVGIWAGVSSLALPAGPLLGGLLVTVAGWRAVFLANLPAVVAAGAATLRGVPADWLGRRTFDRAGLAGVGTATVALGALVFAVIELGRDGLTPAVGSAVVVAIVGAAAFVLTQRRSADPILPGWLAASPAFVSANLVAGAMNVVGIGTIFVTTLYLQVVQDDTALRAGVELLPLFAPLAMLSPVTGRLAARYGPRVPMAAGLLLGAAGMLDLLRLDADSTYLGLLPALLGLGVGMGLLTPAVVAAALRAAPADRAGLASGVTNAVRQAAGALGVAVFGAVAGTPQHPTSFVLGMHRLGVLAAGLWIAAAVLTVAVRPGATLE